MTLTEQKLIDNGWSAGKEMQRNWHLEETIFFNPTFPNTAIRLFRDGTFIIDFPQCAPADYLLHLSDRLRTMLSSETKKKSFRDCTANELYEFGHRLYADSLYQVAIDSMVVRFLSTYSGVEKVFYLDDIAADAIRDTLEGKR